MSIEKVEMYTVSCDHCQRDIGMDQEYSCWNDDSYAEENAMESGWFKHGDKHYCDECHSFDDNDHLVLNETMKDKYKVDIT